MTKAILKPHVLCETKNGNVAYTVGRVLLKAGRPMLVEHVGGVYLEHDLAGRVITPNSDEGFEIVHVHPHHV